MFPGRNSPNPAPPRPRSLLLPSPNHPHRKLVDCRKLNRHALPKPVCLSVSHSRGRRPPTDNKATDRRVKDSRVADPTVSGRDKDAIEVVIAAATEAANA